MIDDGSKNSNDEKKSDFFDSLKGDSATTSKCGLRYQAESLFVQAITGGLFKRCLWALFHTCLLFLSLSVYLKVLALFLPGSACTQNCFLRTIEACCPYAGSTLFRIASFPPFFFLASFISTKITKKQKLMQSVMLTGFSLLVVLGLLVYWRIHWLYLFIHLIVVFLCMFFGFRTALLRKKQIPRD